MDESSGVSQKALQREGVDASGGVQFNVVLSGIDQKDMWLTFNAGISVQPSTGEVKIPDGMALTDAAKRFWNAVADVRHTARPFPGTE